ncbi:hypothetical protein J437_LFUL001233 [Ladona fulva]|uniref:Uncharacterized protein n=1 Tax=Ladona fulva TaxID=123851 RepID=A0A8K0NST1_LADFU|nr:hypothetical protein J437_LFUL001233 [Ladona fulva]
MAPVIGDLLKRPSFWIQFLELILAVICIALLQDSLLLLTSIHKAVLVYMVYSGFILITVMNIIGKVLGEIKKKMAMLWSLVGCVLWIAAAAIILESYSNFKDLLPPAYDKKFREELAAGILGLINGLVYLAEFGLITKLESEE